MSRVHITDDGRILVCKAKDIANCKYGNRPHFNSVEEAGLYIETEITGSNLYNKLQSESDEEILKSLHIREKSKIKEFRAMQERMAANALYGADDPKLYNIKHLDSEEKMAEIEGVINTVMPGKSTKAVHLVGEDSDNWYVWTNHTDLRDVIVYDKFGDNYPLHEMDKRSKYVSHIEVKDLTKDAQLSATPLESDNDNVVGLKLSEETNTSKISQELAKWDPRVDAYSNRKLDLSTEESYDYLLNDYYNKDCQEISFYSDKQNRFINVRLTKKDKENNFETAKARLKENNIVVDVWVRCNMTERSSKLTDSDKQRFLNNYGSMFKDGKARAEFTLDDLRTQSEYELKGMPNRAYVRDRKFIPENTVNKASKRDKTFIRLGDYVFESREDIEKGRKFTLDDFKRITPLLMGNLKEE